MLVWVGQLLSDAFDFAFALERSRVEALFVAIKIQSQKRSDKSVRPTRALLVRRLLLLRPPSFCDYVQFAVEFD